MFHSHLAIQVFYHHVRLKSCHTMIWPSYFTHTLPYRYSLAIIFDSNVAQQWFDHHVSIRPSCFNHTLPYNYLFDYHIRLKHCHIIIWPCIVAMDVLWHSQGATQTQNIPWYCASVRRLMCFDVRRLRRWHAQEPCKVGNDWVRASLSQLVLQCLQILDLAPSNKDNRMSAVSRDCNHKTMLVAKLERQQTCLRTHDQWWLVCSILIYQRSQRQTRCTATLRLCIHENMGRVAAGQTFHDLETALTSPCVSSRSLQKNLGNTLSTADIIPILFLSGPVTAVNGEGLASPVFTARTTCPLNCF